MKKITLMFAALGAALAFTACQDSADDHPTIGKTEGQVVDFLNVPENASTPVDITSDNKEEHMHLTCTQPKEYGFQAPVTYQAQVSLSPDFETPAVGGAPAAVVLSTSFVNPQQIDLPNQEVAQAICKMLDIQTAEKIPTDYHKLYVRLFSNVVTASGQPYENTNLVSNTVVFDQVRVSYLAIIIPGLPTGIYLRGDMNGWGSGAEWEFLTTSEADVYEIADCSIAKDVEFKVGAANWESINYGMGSAEFKLNAPYELASGGGNIKMPQNFRGSVQLTISGGKFVVVFDAVEPDTPGVATGVYIKGDLNGWSDDPLCEFVTTDIKNVWTIADITITPGSFKVADANWGPVNLGSNGQAIKPSVAYKLEAGGGNIDIEKEFVGSATLKIKKGQYTLILEPAQ